MVCVVAYFIVLYLTAFFVDCLRIGTENPRAVVAVAVVVTAAAAIETTPCGDSKTSKLNKLSPKKNDNNNKKSQDKSVQMTKHKIKKNCDV